MTTILEIFETINRKYNFGSFTLGRSSRASVHGIRFNGHQVLSITENVDVKEGSLFQVGEKSTWRYNGTTWIQLIKLVNDTEYQMNLSDDTRRSPIRLQMRKTGSINTILEIGADGYGEKTAKEGYGFPVIIEYHEGHFRVIIWGDINKEDPTHIISLEGAKENVRHDN